jgi:hypothetical protein
MSRQISLKQRVQYNWSWSLFTFFDRVVILAKHTRFFSCAVYQLTRYDVTDYITCKEIFTHALVARNRLAAARKGMENVALN